MKKYKYYNNTNGVVQSTTRNSITNKVEVVVKVNSGQLGVSTSEVYPITFMAMDDTLFTGFSESCTYNASTDEYTLFFPGASISEETITKFMYPSAEWELRVTQTELNELFNEVYQLTGNLVTTPEITGPDAPIVYQGTYANEYSFTASPTLAGNTISSFLVDVSGIGTQVITAADNAGTCTLKIPTTISAGTKLDMYVTATDSQGWKSSPAYKQLTVVEPYVKVPTVVKPTEGQEVIAINFDIQSSTFAAEGLEDTCSKTEFQIQNSSGTTVYTKELTGATYTATITDANLQRGVLYRIRCRQFGTTLTTPSAWSDFVSFRTADIYIQAPTVISPVTGNQIFKYNVVVSGNPFAVVGGGTDTHTASQYRVQNILGTNIYDSGEKTDALTSITIPELTEAVVGETYKISMRYKGATYGWSDWSTDVTVSIKSAYVNAPVLTAPTQNAQIKGTTVAFVQQGFATTGTSDTQTGVQYQLLTADNSVYYDSGELTTDYSAHTATITKPNLEIALRARVRNKGANLGWSAWSAYVNITVSPSLHLSLREDGKILYVGKPDGTPFDRPDGTYYWLGISTSHTYQTSTNAVFGQNYVSAYLRGSFIYDTAGINTNTDYATIRENPSIVDTSLCTLTSTQDGEYSTLYWLAGGIPTTGDALASNVYTKGRAVLMDDTLGKHTHIPSKRELLYLCAQQPSIDDVMGTNFFHTHVAPTQDTGMSSCSCTIGANLSTYTFKLFPTYVRITTITRGTNAPHAWYPYCTTWNCDHLGTLLPDKHNLVSPEDSTYHYCGFGPNTPLFDYYGRRFWACTKDTAIFNTFNVNTIDKLSTSFTENKLNARLNTSARGNNVAGAYPFQIFGASAPEPLWFVSSMPCGSSLGSKPCYVVSPYVMLAKAIYGIIENTNSLYYTNVGFTPSAATTGYAYLSRQYVDYTPDMTMTLQANTSPPGRVRCYSGLHEYLPVDTGRKLYRHSSGMGTVMEYTDADSIKKKVLILDASYRSSVKISSDSTCPSTLTALGDADNNPNIYNAVRNTYITGTNPPLQSMSDTFLNTLWPEGTVDNNSSAYNTQQWLTLASNPDAAQAVSNIKVNGVACQLPNFNVALRMYLDRDAIDALDPTIVDNPTKALGKANPNGIFGMDKAWTSLNTSSCCRTTKGTICGVSSTGSTSFYGIAYSQGYYPVLELDA